MCMYCTGHEEVDFIKSLVSSTQKLYMYLQLTCMKDVRDHLHICFFVQITHGWYVHVHCIVCETLNFNLEALQYPVTLQVLVTSRVTLWMSLTDKNYYNFISCLSGNCLLRMLSLRFTTCTHN